MRTPPIIVFFLPNFCPSFPAGSAPITVAAAKSVITSDASAEEKPNSVVANDVKYVLIESVAFELKKRAIVPLI